MQQIPLTPNPSQTIQIVLGGQNCQISIYQKGSNLFADVALDNTNIVTAVICRDAVPIICRNYVGFEGNVLFIDTQGANDPVYNELGSRYQLLYLSSVEYAKL